MAKKNIFSLFGPFWLVSPSVFDNIWQKSCQGHVTHKYLDNLSHKKMIKSVFFLFHLKCPLCSDRFTGCFQPCTLHTVARKRTLRQGNINWIFDDSMWEISNICYVEEDFSSLYFTNMKTNHLCAKIVCTVQMKSFVNIYLNI